MNKTANNRLDQEAKCGRTKQWSAKTIQGDLSAAAAKQIRRLLETAAIHGNRREVAQALKGMLRRLRNAPLEYGELTRYLKHLNILVHVAVPTRWSFTSEYRRIKCSS